MTEEKKEPQCNCYEYVGDNPDCPVHGKKAGSNDKPADTNTE